MRYAYCELMHRAPTSYVKPDGMKFQMKNERMFDYENTLRSISKQSAIIFLEKIASQFVSFFSSILLARLLGPSLLGRYQLGLVVAQILATFGALGFDRGLVRFIPVFDLDNAG